MSDLKLKNLNEAYFRKGKFEEVGRLEIGLVGTKNKETLAKVNDTLRKYGGLIFSADEYAVFQAIEPTIRSRLYYNLETFNLRIRQQTPVWHPFKLQKGQLLLSWIDDGRRYDKGKGLAHKMYETEHQLTTSSAVVMRHIVFNYNIALITFQGL